MAPVHFRFIYRLPTKNCSRARSRCSRLLRIDRARQTVERIVRHLQRVLEIASLADRQHRAEDLLLKYARLGVDIGNHSGRNEIAVAGH